MAVAYAVMNLFDTTTWADVDYKPLVNPVHKNIAPHVLHQQQYKNYVQIAALTTSNNVREYFHSDQATTLLYLMQGFNKKTIRKEKTGPQKRKYMND